MSSYFEEMKKRRAGELERIRLEDPEVEQLLKHEKEVYEQVRAEQGKNSRVSQARQDTFDLICVIVAWIVLIVLYNYGLGLKRLFLPTGFLVLDTFKVLSAIDMHK